VIEMAGGKREIDRRSFLGDGVRIAGALGLVGVGGLLVARRGPTRDRLWQIDPDKCIACDKCQTQCVLDPSAVRAVQCYSLCGYCDVCTGYFPTTDFELNTGAENQLCPTGAIKREFIEEQAGVRYFEYNIDITRRLIEEPGGVQYVQYTRDDEEKCIGCGKCVKGCALMNGSLYLQVRHDLCVGCNECAIAIACPPQAFYRVPADRPVLLKRKAREALQSRSRYLLDQIARQSSQDKARGLEASLEKVRELLGKDARKIVDQRAQGG
jgi:electron transport complex protein RnfB